jgi:hypothetical protein
MSRVQQRSGTKAKRKCPYCQGSQRPWKYGNHKRRCEKKAAKRFIEAVMGTVTK